MTEEGIGVLNVVGGYASVKGSNRKTDREYEEAIGTVERRYRTVREVYESVISCSKRETQEQHYIMRGGLGGVIASQETSSACNQGGQQESDKREVRRAQHTHEV
jgi:hypothetical protein